MRLARSFIVACSLVAVGLVAGCASNTEDDGAAAGEDAVVQGDRDDARSVTGQINPEAGQANVGIKVTLKDTTIAAVKAKIADPELAMWKGLKRPGEIRIGQESIRMSGAGSALLTDLRREGETVEAYMPFAESGLRSYSGLKFKFSFAVTDSADGFTLDVSNSDKVETRFLGVEVIEANKLTFQITATKAGNDVQVEIKENVAILKSKDKVGRLLGCAIAVADALEAR
jgi:hypothetical protein